MPPLMETDPPAKSIPAVRVQTEILCLFAIDKTLDTCSVECGVITRSGMDFTFEISNE